MDTTFEIPDPSDWLSTALPEIAPLESSLRCQVCKDFFDTPMMTSCSHTFCSLCIRKCLSSDGKCPACRSGDQASKLRQNWAVQEAVDAFTASRKTMMNMARRQSTQDTLNCPAEDEIQGRRGIKRKRDIGMSRDDEGADRRQTRSQSRRNPQHTSIPIGSGEPITIPDSEDSDYTPEPAMPRSSESTNTPDMLVPCPICGKRMKEEYVFSHLDNCTAPTDTHGALTTNTASMSRPTKNQPANTVARTLNSPRDLALQPIAQLNYSLLKDSAFRTKLSELGIPNWGPRQLLIRRHTEWVNIYNANCDSSRPRLKKDLLRELDVWERTQGGQSLRGTAGSNSDVSKKDFDKDVWRDKNKSQFESLVADARERAMKAKTSREALDKEKDGHDALDSRAVIADSQSPEEMEDTDAQRSPSYPENRNLNAHSAETSGLEQNHLSLMEETSQAEGDSIKKPPLLDLPHEPVADVEQTETSI
ncbi:DNA repair protein rad18 [Eremomyces bilateralis CBS 781.70]|uniref:Postreplication repair E3 ubiquitin-protein ligase RAD18 n=1 Tax=Eremomyces bilateralis CBS 781.70 TaxID=1392243 RepID=A0A6G1FXN0_9PEZI|nr:DNA repair protein rad18 [Eremomyces bilateralis CBS 781.70]KAF1810508.1 DNA repair protein rad18 [Eremomyces bilateralis CBS 781.70]